MDTILMCDEQKPLAMFPQTGKTDHFVPKILYPNGKEDKFVSGVDNTYIHTHTHSTVYIYF